MREAHRRRERPRLPHVAGAAVGERPGNDSAGVAFHRRRSVAARSRPLDARHSTLRAFAGLRTTARTHARTDSFKPTLPDASLDQLFRQARTYNRFTGEVDDATLHRSTTC
jgi:hypothetical protein